MTAQAFLAQVQDLVPTLPSHAAALDETASFPADDIAGLTRIGALTAPLPTSAGGLGLGTEPAAGADIFTLLRLLGQGSLAVGRVYEAHVNAIRLIARYGTASVLATATDAARADCLFALWVTDPPGSGLTLLPGEILSGRKQFCSASGYARRAVVTAQEGEGCTRLALVPLERGVTVAPLAGGLQGIRAATTGQVSFDAVQALAFGEDGDYLREPDFSAGAWRTSAVTLGGLDALVDETAAQLRARGRLADPHQQARMGQLLMAQETARLWMQEAAARRGRRHRAAGHGCLREFRPPGGRTRVPGGHYPGAAQPRPCRFRAPQPGGTPLP